MFKCKWFKNEELLLPIKISLDRLIFRHSDSTINMVIQYPNDIMHYFKYIDIILVERYFVKNLAASSGRASSRKTHPKFYELSRKLSQKENIDLHETDEEHSKNKNKGK